MTYTENDVTSTIDHLLGEHADLDVAIAGALDNLDQYHTGGAAALERLIPGLNVAAGDTVLDVGSGLGGPARQIARRTGAQVFGIDITTEYVDAARHLSTKTGPADVVRFELADVTSLGWQRPFDAAATMHVQMNIEKRAEWFGHIADTLRAGGRLVVWEICREKRHRAGLAGAMVHRRRRQLPRHRSRPARLDRSGRSGYQRMDQRNPLGPGVAVTSPRRQPAHRSRLASTAR
jgi:SAM-dependent methyltransferase